MTTYRKDIFLIFKNSTKSMWTVIHQKSDVENDSRDNDVSINAGMSKLHVIVNMYSFGFNKNVNCYFYNRNEVSNHDICVN